MTTNPPKLLKTILYKGTNTTRKRSNQIIATDIEINSVKFPTNGIYMSGDETWTIKDIIPILNGQKQSVQLNMLYSNKTPEFPPHDYEYEVILSWKQSTDINDADLFSTLNNDYTFTESEGISQIFQQQNANGIDAIIEGKVNVSYYMRLAPNFIWSETGGIKDVQEIDGNWKAMGKFSMKGTPWEKSNKQLVFSLYLNDPELLKEIQTVLVLNDMALIKGLVPEVNAILQELGILYITNKPEYAGSINGPGTK